MPRRRTNRKPAKSRKKTGENRSPRIVIGIIITVLILFTLLSLSCYVAGLRSPSTNYCGWLGHWLAFGLHHALGHTAFAVPLLVAALAIMALLKQPPWRRFTGFCLLAGGLLFAASLFSYQAGNPLPDGNFGGWLGVLTGRYLSLFLGLGAYVVPALVIIWGSATWQGGEARRGHFVLSAFALLAGLFVQVFIAYVAPDWQCLPGPGPAFPAPGLAGIAVTGWLKGLLGPVGTLIVLIALAAAFLALFTTFELRSPSGLLRRLAESVAEARARRRIPTPKSRTIPEPVTGRESTPSPPEPAPELTEEPANADGQEPEEIPEPARPRRIRPVTDFKLDDFQSEFLDQLDKPGSGDQFFKDPREAKREAEQLLEKLREFGIDGSISNILSGPMITRFEFEPGPGVKVQRIGALEADIALALSAERIRILAPIPGKNAVGIEIPNRDRSTVHLHQIITSEPFRDLQGPLGFALGTTITGDPFAADIARMPHVLIAGTTGSGKSVCINSIIASIVYRSSPREVRFLTIDPKQLELPIYNPIPHLLSRTTTDPDKAVRELNEVVKIMEVRYGEFAELGVRDIATYNQRAKAEGLETKPYIVVVIDELADLMLRAPTEIEQRITRLAQMSRAVGIHLVLATQRPSVDVITGLIKANFPCRIAFQVASKTDSRTILDMNGAEALLGRGDMLFLPPGKGDPVRLHGSFISAAACIRVVNLWTTAYLTRLLEGKVEDPAAKARAMVERDVVDALFDRRKAGSKRKRSIIEELLPEEVADELMEQEYYEPLPEVRSGALTEHTRKEEKAKEARKLDEKLPDAARIVVRHKEASVSMLQRRLDIGWARAGRIIDQLEDIGIVGPYVGSKSRKVLVRNESELEDKLAGDDPPAEA